MGNFVRVRVALPVYRMLETSVVMTAKVKEERTMVEFQILYEKLPHFCYTCGFLGHQDKSCGRKLRGGAPSGKYSGRLRCSPPRHFMQQTGIVRTRPTYSYRGLDFSSGSNSSSVHGKDGQGAHCGGAASVHRNERIAYHSSGNSAIDELLPEQMSNMSAGDR